MKRTDPADMNEDELVSKTEKLIDECAKAMKRHVAQLIASKAIEPETHEKPFRLPKVILAAVLRYEAKSWELMDGSAQTEANGVYRKLYRK